MPLGLAYELWSELKRHVSTVDREAAADDLVSVLIENNYDAEDIRQAFKGDSDVRRALAEVLDDGHDEELDDYPEDDYDEDEY